MKTGHPLQAARVSIALNASFDIENPSDTTASVHMDDAFIGDNNEEPFDSDNPGGDIDLQSPPGEQSDPSSPPSHDPSSPPSQDPWFPFKSRAHFYMTTLYHGSHRRNFDQQTLQAILDILRVYVPVTEYFPTMDDVVNFKNEFWESKIFETRIDQGNVFSFLRPEGMVALRLGNPVLSGLFDRVPRKTLNSDITTQSSASKFKEFAFRKLGNLLVGDLVQLDFEYKIVMEGHAEKVPCKVFFHIQGFYIQGSEYKVEGKYFFHSSLQEMQYLRARVGNNDCFIMIRNLVGDLKFGDMKYCHTLRSRNQQPSYCPYMYDEGTSQFMYQMPGQQLDEIKNSLNISMQESCVQVMCNLHVDDASQVSSKMWKSCSVFDLQLAGAPAGVKGGESNNIILGLTDTSKISLKRLFDGMCEEFVRLERDGFECFDCFTGKIEKVKLPVGAVFGDLPAKAEITPFIGHQANHFCSRDMYDKSTDTGLDIPRDLRTLRRQILEIQNERTLARKKRLGTKFGLDFNNLDSVLDTLLHFDLTTDLPSDILHHFTLGWGKKSFIYLKNDILSDDALDKLCQIFDQLIWKEYKSRTNSNALRKAGSQIGRNIKSLLQVVWYGIWVLIGSNPELRADLEIFLRVFFYLGKINYLFYNEHEVGWSDAILTEADDAIKTSVAIFKREMEVLVPGAKSHDLEYHILDDIKRHGSPAGFDCQAGESKMKIQKLKNNYSNKQAPGKDVALKYMKTEIIRHINSGGILSEDGRIQASPKVIQEAARHKSLRSLLGMELVTSSVGKASLMDYVEVNGKKKVKLSKPSPEHVQLGIPNQDMKTCTKVETSNGPLYRDGGLYYTLDGDVPKMGVLQEVYKSVLGACYAVIEKMVDVTNDVGDPFLNESNIKLWKKSGHYFTTSNLHQLHSVPLLHACSYEELSPCKFSTGVVDVREERQIVQQMKTVYNCIGRKGKRFLVNSTALSIPTGIGFGCC